MTKSEKMESLEIAIFDLQKQLVKMQKAQLLILERLAKIQAGNTRHNTLDINDV